MSKPIKIKPAAISHIVQRSMAGNATRQETLEEGQAIFATRAGA